MSKWPAIGVRYRVAILLILAAAILLLRGFQFYYTFAKDYAWERQFRFVTDVRNGRLFVKSVVEQRFEGGPTAAHVAGLEQGDEIIAIYNSRGVGIELKRFFDLGEVWKTVRTGESISIKALREGKTLILMCPYIPPPVKGFRYWFVNSMLILIMPLLILFIAFFLGFAKPEDDNAFFASLLFITFSFVFGMGFQYFPPVLRDFGVLFSVTCVSICAYLFTRFFLVFPARSILDRKFPWIRTVLLVITIIFWIINTVLSYLFFTSFRLYEQVSKWIEPLEPFLGISQVLIISVGLISLALHFLKADTKDEKRKTGILLAGAFMGIVPLSIFLSTYASGSVSTPPFWAVTALVFSIALFPLSFLYVVLRHRVLGIRLIVRRGLQYALVSRGFFLIEGFLIFAIIYLALSALRILNYTEFGLTTIFITAVAAFGVAFALRQINEKAMSAIDRRFFRHAYNTQQVLTELARGVRRLAAQPERLFDLVTDQLSDALMTDKVAVFLRRADAQAFLCHGLRVRSGYHDEVWSAPAEYRSLCFRSDSLIARQLKKFESEETECMEVYLNDPKSWASALMKADPNDSHFQEKMLIEKMNTKLIVPLVSGEEILGFLSLGEKLSEEAYSKEDKELLLSVGEQTAIALEYSHMISQVAEQEKLKKELQIATEVQARLFPQIFPPMKTLEYTGYCKAALAVGGDYYDFLLLDERTLGVALGDVSGKGISSALLMANLQALLRSGAPLRGEQIDHLMSDINRLLCESTPTRKYATLFYCIYEDQHRMLTYVNAGHLPPIVFRADGSMDRLSTGGLVVGMLPDVIYKKDKVQLNPGDILVIYSDGLSEAMNVEEAEFGEEQVIEEVTSHRISTVEELRDRLLKRVSDFVGDAPQHDDLTMVIARVL